MDKEKNISEEQAEEELKKGYKEAEETLKDDDKMERLFQRLEKKLKSLPVAGERLADIPIMASLVRNFWKKEYTDIPIGSIIAIVSALTYFISPVDLIPDGIPGLGFVDDAAVIAACWALVASDVEEYQEWREKNNKMIEL